jgi:chromosome segregation ATPase
MGDDGTTPPLAKRLKIDIETTWDHASINEEVAALRKSIGKPKGDGIMPRLLREHTALKAALSVSEKKTKESEHRNQELEERLRSAKEEAEKLREGVTKAGCEKDDAIAEQAALREKLNAADLEKQKLESQIKQLSSELQSAQADEETARTAHANEQQKPNEAVRAREFAEGQLETARSGASRLQEELDHSDRLFLETKTVQG